MFWKTRVEKVEQTSSIEKISSHGSSDTYFVGNLKENNEERRRRLFKLPEVISIQDYLENLQYEPIERIVNKIIASDQTGLSHSAMGNLLDGAHEILDQEIENIAHISDSEKKKPMAFINKLKALCEKVYLQGAQLGDDTSQNQIGMIYQKQYKYVESLNWYRKSAEQGNMVGQYNLGFMLFHGMGTKPNLTEAKKWIFMSAEQGFPPAIESLNYLR